MNTLLPVPAAILNFWILPFFDRKLGFKGTNGAYIRDQQVRIYKMRHFFENLAKFAKKVNFGGHIEFLTRHFNQKLMT